MSLPVQSFDLREISKSAKLPIIESLSDSKTAKRPGRPDFDYMMKKIEKGMPFRVGILAWSVDRLSRNPFDDATIMQLLKSGKLADLKFKTFHFENTAMGRYLLSIQFAQAQYHIGAHAEGVTNTADMKLRRGQWPGFAIFGLRFNKRKGVTVHHPRQAPLLLALFEEFAKGTHTYDSILAWFNDLLRKNRQPRRTSVFAIKILLQKTIYMGIILWKGKNYEAKFKPIISRTLFNRVQAIINRKNRPRFTRQLYNFPFRALFTCSCGACITAQFATGHGGRYAYYRCTRNSGPCTEPYIGDKLLKSQVVEWLRRIAPSKEILTGLHELAEQAKTQSEEEYRRAHSELMSRMERLQERQGHLIDLHLNQPLDNDVFDTKQNEYLAEKTALKEQIFASEARTLMWWIEPCLDAISALQEAAKLNMNTKTDRISALTRKVGSNHRISAKNVSFELVPPYDSVASILAELRTSATTSKPVRGTKNPQSPHMCMIFAAMRTVFERPARKDSIPRENECIGLESNHVQVDGRKMGQQD